MRLVGTMKVKYFYQQLGSHIIIVLSSFLILSLMFSHFIKNFVYENKVEDLTAFGEHVLSDLLSEPSFQNWATLMTYNKVLEARHIRVFLFDENGDIFIAKNSKLFPKVNLNEQEWNKLQNGERVAVYKDFGRFDEGVTFVALPYIYNGEMKGGVLLISPISGTTKVIEQINQYFLITIIVSLIVAIVVSYVLSRIFERRVQKLRDATSMVANGNYEVNIEEKNNDEIGALANDFNQMVKKLKHSQDDIERLEKRRRQFIADVSHELRTPLTTIRGLIEGLKNHLVPDEQRERSMDLIEKETLRLIRLVNENLDYEKIRSNQVILNKENIPLLEVFEIIQEQLAIQAKEKKNCIIIDAPENLLIYADYDRLIQILMNITKNSIQFTSNGTIILKGKRGYKETIIEIKDTGIGIDKEEIESIWLRFYKADISRKSTSYGEFGLGLSIVKQLVLLHKGSIEVFSEKNKGTKFIMTFPDPIINEKAPVKQE